MSPLLKVLLWLALPVAVCVWAVAHGQMPPHMGADPAQGGAIVCAPGFAMLHGECVRPNGSEWYSASPPTRPNVRGAVLTDDVRKICRRGYSRSVRPPEWASEAYKRQLLHELPPSPLGITFTLRDFELDDRVPLELGGKPGADNYWLQPIEEAHAKDREEDAIHKEVCAGRINIHDAQRYFLSWPDGTLQ